MLTASLGELWTKSQSQVTQRLGPMASTIGIDPKLISLAKIDANTSTVRQSMSLAFPNFRVFWTIHGNPYHPKSLSVQSIGLG
jgi:hypothetical protein